MKELIEYIAKSIVNNPDEVVVKETFSENGKLFELSVAPDDMGKIIGKQGRVANAMRTLLRVAAVKQGTRAELKIVEQAILE